MRRTWSREGATVTQPTTARQTDERGSGGPSGGVCAGSFALKDCALLSLATGLHAHDLREFRDALRVASLSSIYHHFWERMLRPQFDEPEYNNDFASWAFHGLHLKGLAEQLSMVDPSDSLHLEVVRGRLLDIVERRLDESETVPSAAPDQQFSFLRSRLVIFDTGERFDHPGELAVALPRWTTGSIYYHFIDARWRNGSRCDDLSAWLRRCGAEFEPLCDRLAAFDPYFSSLERIRDMLADLFAEEMGAAVPGHGGETA
jgi:hypothetical protein